MKGDFSRKTFEATRHYSGVLMQQGRVQLDADWNEQLAIQRHRDYAEAEDVIGRSGAPKHDAGFRIEPAPDGADLVVFPGRYYVDGRLCELEGTAVDATFASTTAVTVARWRVDGAAFAPGQYLQLTASNVASAVVRVQSADAATRTLTLASDIAAFQSAQGLKATRLLTYLTQPDLPDPAYASASSPPMLELPDGAYLAYLDVWPRHLTALDDPHIREKALGGPDTASRVKTLWQVKLWPGPDDAPALPDDTACGSSVPGYDALVAPSTGRLAARARPGDEPSPCVLPPGAGYLGLENQLYRVEIHAGGTLGTDAVTFKWSRDNGAVVKPILPIASSTDHTVPTGPDDVLGLANGQWVEQVDDATELNAVARGLFQFQRDPLTGAVTLGFPVDEERHPQLRRWDSPDVVAIPWPPVDGGWIALEKGVEVRFEAGSYRTGDYWLVPARTVMGDVEWPVDGAGEPLAEPRRGIRHHYARIGVVTAVADALAVEDCRPIFPPLNELKPPYSCCTFTVGDGIEHVGDFTLIQEAVNHLPAEGGQICIFPGTYVENVRIEGRKDVHIKGCGARTIVSAPVDGDALPVFHLVATGNVRIESLGIVAAETAPGILADGETPNRGLALEKLLVKAAAESGLKIRGSEDVSIQSCHVQMTDLNGGFPGIHLQAETALVRENAVTGGLGTLTALEALGVDGNRWVSGIQVAGGSLQVRLHDNLVRGVSGQGITLGSVVEVDENGDPVTPAGGGGTDDPCDACDEPSTGDDPPQEGDEPKRLESEGLVRDVDIRRNRIFDVGLDGIGVARFFDVNQAGKRTASVLIQDLTIVDNRIERCVRRRFGLIPTAMVDLMAYGGIALSFVEGLVVRDNRIEDMGAAGLLPACGLFVFYVEGLEVSRNLILNSGSRTASADPPATGRAGGIHVVYAVPLAGALPKLDASGGKEKGTRRRAAPAAVVEGNTVDVVRGPALSMGALGPVSVVANRLTSRGLVDDDLGGLFKGESAAVLHLASLVVIVNLGSTGGGPVNLAAGTKDAPGSSANPFVTVTNKKVLFDDNQCVLDLRQDRPGAGPALPGNFLLPAVLVLSLDDLGFADNQVDCVVPEGKVLLVANALVGLLSQRTIGNRFGETLGTTYLSALTFGLMNMTVNNQANHCLRAIGPLRLQALPNHVLISLFLEGFCASGEKQVADTMKAFS